MHQILTLDTIFIMVSRSNNSCKYSVQTLKLGPLLFPVLKHRMLKNGLKICKLTLVHNSIEIVWPVSTMKETLHESKVYIPHMYDHYQNLIKIHLEFLCIILLWIGTCIRELSSTESYPAKYCTKQRCTTWLYFLRRAKNKKIKIQKIITLKKLIGCNKKNKNPMGYISHLRNQFIINKHICSKL